MPNHRPRTSLYLWEFLLELLDGEEPCPEISWINREKGIFVLKNQDKIAKLWGEVKGRPQMDRIKLGRAMRYYYKKEFLAKVRRQKGVYRFTKLNVLEQSQETLLVQSRDLPEIDINDNEVLDLIGDESTVCKPPSRLDPEKENTVTAQRTKITTACASGDIFPPATSPSEVTPVRNTFKEASERPDSCVVFDEENNVHKSAFSEINNRVDNISYDCRGDSNGNFNKNQNDTSSERPDESLLFNCSIDLALFN